MKQQSFRFCMLVGAGALLGVAIYYFTTYVVVLKIALANSGVQPFIQQSIRALWLSFASQAMLIGLLYLLVSWRPHTVSREVIVLLGLIQLVEAGLLFSLAGSVWLSLVLVIASAFVLFGAMLWPRKLAPGQPQGTAGAATPSATG